MAPGARTWLVALLLLGAGMAGCIGDGEEVDLNSLRGLEVQVTPESGEVDTEFTFDASGTPGADGLAFTWSFGDGQSAEGQVVTHTFAYTNNLYKVEVTATRGNQSLTDTVEVPVGTGENADPTVTMETSTTWVGHGDELVVTAETSDPDGDPVEVTWLMTKDQSQSDGHDHDHGGSGGSSGFGIPEPTGKTGPEATFTFQESGTYRIVAKATDPKGASTLDQADIKVTQSVPKTTFTFHRAETLTAGTAGAGASMLLYDLLQPSQNTHHDASRYNFRLIYPGTGSLTLDWSNATGPADLDLFLKAADGETLYDLSELDPMTTRLETDVDLKPGNYVVEVYAMVGAQVPYDLVLDLDLLIPGLTVDKGGHGDGHDGHDH